MDIKEVLNLKNGSVVKFTLNEREHILEVWDSELFIQSTGVSATNLFLLKTLVDTEYKLIKEGESYVEKITEIKTNDSKRFSNIGYSSCWIWSNLRHS